MSRPVPYRILPLIALLALPLTAWADDDEDDEPGISACELCDSLDDVADSCAREFGEGHVNDVVCDAISLVEEGCDEETTGARDGDHDDDDDDDDDDDEDHDGDECHDENGNECPCDDDNRVCIDQCAAVPGLIEPCAAEVGPGHGLCEALQRLADDCAENPPPADTGDTADTASARSRLPNMATCDVMGASTGAGLLGALGLLGLWTRRRR